MTFDITDPRAWDANLYRKLGTDFTAWYAEQALTLAALPKGARVIDIACGTGALSALAARGGAEVLATDFAPAMVEATAALGLPNLEARVMDGQALDLPDATFDAAFSMFGVMLFPDWRAGMREMGRVVRPGGIGCIGTWKSRVGAASNLLLERICNAFLPEIDTMPSVTGMETLRDPARLTDEMGKAGFAEVRVSEVTHDYQIDAQMNGDPETLFKFSSVWPLLSEAQRDFVVTTIARAIEVRGGALAVPSPALIAIGRKEG